VHPEALGETPVLVEVMIGGSQDLHAALRHRRTGVKMAVSTSQPSFSIRSRIAFAGTPLSSAQAARH
jgi:hypothetical protein